MIAIRELVGGRATNRMPITGQHDRLARHREIRRASATALGAALRAATDLKIGVDTLDADIACCHVAIAAQRGSA